MDFRVLGPVQVIAGSGPIELASGRQLALLCCLLIAGDEVSSRDRLIDALWGEQPPRTATNALQVQVHALRRRLGPDRIAREATGYRLRREPGELDLERFELLVARGRSERADAAVGPFARRSSDGAAPRTRTFATRRSRRRRWPASRS
jgi:DNA-binding SARP family transcriptional activator